MRLHGNHYRRYFLPLGLIVTVSACGGSEGYADLAPAPVANGPAADYPVIVGDPYEIGGITYTPADIWNYDEVGYLSLDREGGSNVSGSHRTLPYPSYVEVTSLDTGQTILVRLERRGPMTGQALVALSQGALAQLGQGAGDPVRVRRVNPPELERAKLRAGEMAPARMETPMSLVNVLRRKLPGGEGDADIQARQSDEYALQPLEPLAAPTMTPPAAPVAASAPASPPEQAIERGYIVQAGAFSTRIRADRVAGIIGGKVSKAGNFYRVRTGPFGELVEAEASLAKVQAAGYSEARIYTGG